MSEKEKIKLPAIVVKKMTMIPMGTMQLNTNEEVVKKAAQKAYKENKIIFIVTEYDEKTGRPYPCGTVSRIQDINNLNNEVMQIRCAGLYKGIISAFDKDGEYMTATIIPENREVMEKEIELDPIKAEVIRRELGELVTLYFNSVNVPTQHKKPLLDKWNNYKTIPEYMELIMSDLPVEYRLKQTFLDMSNIHQRFELLVRALNDEVSINNLKGKIEKKVRKNMDKAQREYILREELKVINEELDGETAESEVDELAHRLKVLDAPEEIKEKIDKEIKRFKKLSYNSPEANVSRGYITTLLDIPWETESEDDQDINRVKMILDEDHYGIEKVKERILEFLAVRNITQKGDVPVLCLYGPPGTGKTSIAKSIARSIGKEYVRIALGGVHDEAEIRGHRRTYVGAMPGRIISGLIDAKVKNPLILLDEVDKVKQDYKGDTAAALLEVLDSEQNSKFVDHYVDLPVDLSEVLFITTANDISQISSPLLDRMEIIELNSYTRNEKMHIAKEHLIPKQIIKNGLKNKNLKITDKALDIIIAEYTAEAGVRNLERKIAEICRKAVKELYDNGELKDEKITVTGKNIEDYLGKEKAHIPKLVHKPLSGVVHGLAWTSVGGTVMDIEVNTVPGKGDLILTGKLGDVMKESATIALSFVKSILKDMDEFFEKNTVHIHIPAGAVPKDGPSAGITMALAIYSAVTGKKVDGELAMTGEITLRGLVLPIGGLKEKLLAAAKSGIKKVLVPSTNKADVDNLDEEITGELEIVYVDTMKEVLEQSIVKD